MGVRKIKTVMIVDDEILVRVGIKSIVNWEESGYIVVGEASNGNDAIKKIPLLNPDIILTDLYMDEMDGFGLIKHCALNFPRIKLIVLSNYNDFDNVKKAMKVGAVDYIFKLTAKPEEIIKIMNEIKVGEGSEASKYDELVVKNQSALKTKLIKTAVRQKYQQGDEIINQAVYLKTKCNFSKPFIMLYISIDDFTISSSTEKINEIELLKYSIENVISEALKNSPAEVFNYSQGDLILILNVSDNNYDTAAKEMSLCFETIVEYIKRYIGISVSGALSGAYSGVEQLKAAVEDCMCTIKQRFWSDGGRLFLRNGKQNIISNRQINTDDFYDILVQGNFTKAREFLLDFFNMASSCTSYDEEKTRMTLMSLYNKIIKTAQVYNIESFQSSDNNVVLPFDAITKYDLFCSIKQNFMEYFEGFVDFGSMLSSSKKRADIADIKIHVRNNLVSDLSVSAVAKKIHMSENYFSHTFKKETGTNFVDFVNKERMMKACELLKSTGMKINEIAFAVGISNSNYFSVLFKKIIGKSPVEYRQ